MDVSQKKEYTLSRSLDGVGDTRTAGRRWKMLELSLLCVIVLVIWVSLAMPVIFFYIPVVSCIRPFSGLCGVGVVL